MVWDHLTFKEKLLAVGTIIFVFLLLGLVLFLLLAGNMLIVLLVIIIPIIPLGIKLYSLFLKNVETKGQMIRGVSKYAKELEDPVAKKIARNVALDQGIYLEKVRKTTKGNIKLYEDKGGEKYLFVPEKTVKELKSDEITEKEFGEGIKTKLQEETGDDN